MVGVVDCWRNSQFDGAFGLPCKRLLRDKISVDQRQRWDELSASLVWGALEDRTLAASGLEEQRQNFDELLRGQESPTLHDLLTVEHTAKASRVYAHLRESVDRTYAALLISLLFLCMCTIRMPYSCSREQELSNDVRNPLPSPEMIICLTPQTHPTEQTR